MTEIRERVEAAFEVSAGESGSRLDQVLAARLPEHSRARIQGWIRAGEVSVNGRLVKPRERVMHCDRVTLDVQVYGETRWEAQPIALDIVHEDEHLIVLNKPAGLVVHPAAGHAEGTLVNALLHHAPELDHLPRAGIVHRLDKDTSGLMVVARSLQAHTALVEQLQERTMGREYEALVVGVLTGGGVVDAPIGRHPRQRKKMAVVENGKPAVTHYRLIQRFAAHTHIRCRLESGRTHQIRVHMAHIRHPILGDPVYGGRLRLPPGSDAGLKAILRDFRRQALHAAQLTLIHPGSGEQCTWQAPAPADFCVVRDALAANASGATP